MVHRDVRPGNILFDEQSNAFLGDFAIAVQVTATTETGTVEGSGTYSGVWLQNMEDGTFTYSGRTVFMGAVEGCGSGTLYLTVDDRAGFSDETGLNYTSGNMKVLPGGTLPLAGTLDLAGIQQDHPDGTGTIPITGSYVCAGAGD